MQRLKKEEKFEDLGEGFFVATSKEHKFGLDSFLLCDFAKILRKDVVADFGAGNGILSILVCKKYAPKKIYAFEILDSAVEVLKKSVLKSNLKDKILIFKKDIKSLDKEFFQMFDKIICNPPYKGLNHGVISKNPLKKVIRHESLITINQICKKANQLLRFNGSIFLSGRVERMSEIFSIMKENSLEPKTLQLCAKDKKTAPWLFLVEGRKKAKSFLKVLPSYFTL